MKIQILDYNGKMPKRQHYNDAGADVFAKINSPTIPPHSTVKIPLGFGLVIPDGYMGLIFPRSSLSAKGITCELPPIDSGYRGEVHAIVTNHSDQYFNPSNMRIGQLVILPIVIADFDYSLGDERGNDAFGSTGE